LLVQLQFLSSYKIKNTLLLDKSLDANVKDGKDESSCASTKTILTTNVHIFYILLFLSKFNASNSPNHKNADLHNEYKELKKPTNLKVSFFFLPVTKKNVIFLRAPYKNKLARLNILRLSYSFFFSIYTPYQTTTFNCSSDLNHICKFFQSINLSSFKIKHTKTRIKLPVKYDVNFLLINFN